MSKFFPRNILTGTILSVALTTAATNVAVAEGAFEEEMEYGQGVMEILSWNSKAIGDMLKGKTPYDADKVKTHAKDIASVASLDIAAGFPEDSVHEDSAALSDIWFDFADFEQKLADFGQAADNLNAAAQSGDQAAVGQAMDGLGKSCKSCHKKYKN